MKKSTKPTKTKNNLSFRKSFLRRVVIGLKNDKMAFVETFAIAFLSVLSWIFIDRNPIAAANQYFFWPMLGPIIISLRYGFAKGFICYAVMALSVYAVHQYGIANVNFSLPIILGTGLIVMITGEFTDYWRKTLATNEQNYKYMEQKVESFTQSYYLLKISHDQLEQKSASQLMSLRTSIQILQKTALTQIDNRVETLSDECLHILSDVVGMYEAGLYKVKDGNINIDCISKIGKEHRLVADDPMLLDAMNTKRIHTPANINDHENKELNYQLVIPLVDSSSTLQGIILSEKVKFIALTDENLALTSLVASYMANFMSEKLYTPILKAEQADIFNQYLEQLHWNKKHYGVDSALVVFVDNSDDQKIPIKKFIDYRRGADIYWNCYTDTGEHAMVALLPMTTAYEAKMFVDRLLGVVKNTYKADTEQVEVFGPYVVFDQLEEVGKLLSALGNDPYNDVIRASLENNDDDYPHKLAAS